MPRNRLRYRPTITDMEKKTKHAMTLKNPLLDTSYLPVPWEYREIIDNAIGNKTVGKIFYFCKEEGVCEAKGSVARMNEITGEGLFIILDLGEMIRVDRIITLFGKPGAAYDEYNAYANACMDCSGGR